MKARIAFLAVGMFVFALGFHAQSTPSLPSHDPSAQCAVTVPTEWGEYEGASSYGVAFKDTSGTLRFVTHFPCGFDSPPTVALAIKRK